MQPDHAAAGEGAWESRAGQRLCGVCTGAGAEAGVWPGAVLVAAAAAGSEDDAGAGDGAGAGAGAGARDEGTAGASVGVVGGALAGTAGVAILSREKVWQS